MREESASTADREHAVVIVGAGPTGLMLAGELALANVDVAIVERRESSELTGLRAGGLHMRTLELLDQRGIVERFLAAGRTFQSAPFARIMLDLRDAPTRHAYFLALRQSHIERLLTEWVAELGVPIYRGSEVVDVAQRAARVHVTLASGATWRAQYLVGCDGGRSVVRKLAGIDIPGSEPTTSYLIAEIETADEPAWGIRRGEKGIYAIGKLEDGSGTRVVLNEGPYRPRGEPTIEDIRQTLTAAYGTDYGLASASHISRFTDAARQAAAYRSGRTLLAGDAAHVHSPVGGQGLNLGLQDAVNLGWKLAQVVHGTSPESLLDSYHAERHAAGARVLRNTLALTAIDRGDDCSDALREMLSEMLVLEQPRKHYVAMLSGLDVHYDLGAGHPQLGRRMPDLEVQTASGPRRVYTLLHTARPLLLNLGAPDALESESLDGRVQRLDAHYEGRWELPVLGDVPRPSAVLIRPDGYVAWVGSGTSEGLADALGAWFGTSSTL